MQKAGEPIEEVRPGDVVWFAPNEKHWHGASPKVAMSHVAMQEALDGSPVDMDGEGERRGLREGLTNGRAGSKQSSS